MEVRKEVNYKIDWDACLILSGDDTHDKDARASYDKITADRKHYFSMLRRFLLDIKNLGLDNIDEVFEKYKVHFVDIDDIPRVNLDEPE